MVLGIQIAGFLFGLFMIYYSFLNFKRKEFTVKEFSFWLFLWIIFIIITLFPFILDPIVKTFGFFRTLDLLIISGFLFLIAAIFYTYTIVRKNQNQLEKIVREMAMMSRNRKAIHRRIEDSRVSSEMQAFPRFEHSQKPKRFLIKRNRGK